MKNKRFNILNLVIWMMERNNTLLWENQRPYIAQFMAQRILSPKCIRLKPNNILLIEFINVVQPFKFDKIPPNLWDYLILKLNNTLVYYPYNSENYFKSAMIWDNRKFIFSDLKGLLGVTVPVGAHISLKFPCPTNISLSIGKKCIIVFGVHSNNETKDPYFLIKIERIVS